MARAKKEKFHSTAPQEVVSLLCEEIDAHHKDLKSTEFLILFKHGGWRSKGKTVFGKMKVLGDDLRSTWGTDVILYLNADMWGVLTKPQKKYVLDHQLYTLDLKYDRHGSKLKAPDGRPLLATVPPDIEAYSEVVKRHGIIMEDVKRLAIAMTETSQITLEEVLKFEHNENAAAEFRGKVEESERTGIAYTIDAGNSVQVKSDELDMDAEIAKMDEGAGKVTDLETERKKRGSRQKEEEEPPVPTDGDATDPRPDDDLPF